MFPITEVNKETGHSIECTQPGQNIAYNAIPLFHFCNKYHVTKTSQITNSQNQSIYQSFQSALNRFLLFHLKTFVLHLFRWLFDPQVKLGI
jgi:hypothetical protein